MVNIRKKPIHIAHVVYSFATGGLENGVVNIINRLPEHEYIHSIICITDHDKEFFNRITVANVEIYDLDKPAGKGISWLFKCWRLLKKLKPDICHSRNLNALEAQLAAFLAGVSTRTHGEHGWDVSDLGGSNVKYQKLRKFFRPFIHQYIALSLEAKNYLLEKIGVQESKINHICNGVDVSKFKPNKNRSLLPRDFTDDDSLIFGTVGRLAEVKNQTFLVSSFLELWQQIPEKQNNLKLVIIGDGVLMPKLKTMVAAADANRAVWFAGRRDNVSELMNQFDVFVLPSLAEGISNTLLEAMASGLPYIATDVGGNADLVLPQHKNSHIVEVNNNKQLISAMQIYVDSPDKLLKEIEQVRSHCVENFSLAGMVEKYHQFYQKKYN
jgi:sugar transferase (PEP-CTERM/EpsH1 system associated)